MTKKIISWLFVILWAIFIFYMSSMDSDKSTKESKNTINTVIKSSVKITNKIGITNIKLTKNKMNKLINKLNTPIRKCAHAFEYFIFVILILNAISISNIIGINSYIISILICFIYASTDEIHQLFISGRSGQITDVLIDTSGGVLGLILYYLILKFKNKKNK